LTALNQVEEIEGQTHKTILPHTRGVDNICPNTDDVLAVCFITRYRKGANQTFNKKTGLDFPWT
jgi:tRNA nucleotidyltransferase (CCA-adding enzyme)